MARYAPSTDLARLYGGASTYRALFWVDKPPLSHEIGAPGRIAALALYSAVSSPFHKHPGTFPAIGRQKAQDDPLDACIYAFRRFLTAASKLHGFGDEGGVQFF
jgi:hypothetical protein